MEAGAGRRGRLPRRAHVSGWPESVSTDHGDAGPYRGSSHQVNAMKFLPSLWRVAVAIGLSATLNAQSSEELPRRQYESGLSFMKGQRYNEALKDFQAIIDSFPKSQVADNALL